MTSLLAVTGTACQPIVNCDLDRRFSIDVAVVDDRLLPVADATVRSALDGEPATDCGESSGGYHCGDGPGEFVITAEKSGYDAAEVAVTVFEEDATCHRAANQSVSLTLQRRLD